MTKKKKRIEPNSNTKRRVEKSVLENTSIKHKLYNDKQQRRQKQKETEKKTNFKSKYLY